ncbi:MAG: signal peptide peptidase SppA [Bacteroidales bacterium]|nr:signal peptide peptidase SppA [Bacteroidales bacterium]MCF8456514.1 signal peptide peptidase SppA [Bacteroidales bacterium]
MKEFFKFLFSSFIGTFLALIFIFFILIGMVVAVIPKEEVVKAKPNTVLKITLDQAIADRTPSNPLENFNFQDFDMVLPLGLNDILKNLDKAKTDDNIKGIYLELDMLQCGFATLEEIRDALLDFKESGKFIVAYGDFYSQGAYYLATVADKIYMNPEGNIDYRGLRAELMFFKGTLDKFGIEPEIIRGTGNQFKSAVEPFMYDKMSEANRLQTQTFLNSLWNQVLKGISEQRNISIAELNKLSNEMTIDNATAALDNKMIDGIKYYDEVQAELKELCSLEPKKDLTFLTMDKYKKAPKTSHEFKGLAKDKLAVIYASGEIGMGKGDEKTIGSETLSKAIRDARLDTAIKAIVLRINSPGGSALASEIILREVMLAREAKPVVVSMGDLAASGGYYIACLADTIVASENTLTGSIGVFGLLFNMENFLDDKLGITVDRVTTNDHSDLGSVTRKMTPDEKLVIQKRIDEIYHTFISHVAEGRHLSTEKVDEIGQGRVWSGSNAMEIGLIDVYGGLSKSIEIAKEMAGLDHFRIVEYPKQKDLEQIISDLTGSVKANVLEDELGENLRYYENMKKVLKQQGILARMPFEYGVY